jgi:hypothetical protein
MNPDHHPKLGIILFMEDMGELIVLPFAGVGKTYSSETVRMKPSELLSERVGHPVYPKALEQSFVRVNSDKLSHELDGRNFAIAPLREGPLADGGGVEPYWLTQVLSVRHPPDRKP